jgi:hypothetical protein
VAVFARAFSPGPLEGFPGTQNPLGIASLAGLLPAFEGAWEVVGLALVFVAAVSLLVRVRRARGEERQQVKWLLYAATLLSVAGLLTLSIESIGTGWAGLVLITVGFLAVPVAIGFAILRHRLYDIDILINRTLVYGVLTVALVLAYVGGIVLFQGIFRALMGQGSQLRLWL